MLILSYIWIGLFSFYIVCTCFPFDYMVMDPSLKLKLEVHSGFKHGGMGGFRENGHISREKTQNWYGMYYLLKFCLF